MVSTLGLSCPSGGAFYICDKSAQEFIGCCTSDPCADGSGHCPKDNLRSSSFSGDKYADVPAQECTGNNETARWYTCMATLPPFLGCCSGNPCATGACLANELEAARLSPDSAARAAFLALETPTQPASADNGGSGMTLPAGAIWGIAIGGLVFVLAIVAVVVYKCGWYARKRKERESFIAPILAGAGTGTGMRESVGSQGSQGSQNINYPPCKSPSPHGARSGKHGRARHDDAGLALTDMAAPATPSFGYCAHSPTSPSYTQFQAGAMPSAVRIALYGTDLTDDGQMSPHQGGANTSYPALSELDTVERRIAELPASDPDLGSTAPSRPLLSGTTPPLGSPSGPNPLGSRPPIPDRRDNGNRRVSGQSNHGPPS